MPASALALLITEHQCACGNKWTSSRASLLTQDKGLGGTPFPGEERTLPIEQIFLQNNRHYRCFRCITTVSVKVVNWQIPLLSHPFDRPPPREARAATDVLSTINPDTLLTPQDKANG